MPCARHTLCALFALLALATAAAAAPSLRGGRPPGPALPRSARR